MENRLIESLAARIADALNKYGKKDGLNYVKLKYGAEIFIVGISKQIILLIAAAVLNTLPQSLVMLAAFTFLRRFAFGLHSKNSTVCTAISLLIFVGAPKMLSFFAFSLNSVYIFLIFCFVMTALYKYAPADTEAHPILNAKLRRSLKIKSVLCGLFLMALALFLRKETGTLIVFSALFEVVTILPVTYRLLKRRINNYEAFENGS